MDDTSTRAVAMAFSYGKEVKGLKTLGTFLGNQARGLDLGAVNLGAREVLGKFRVALFNCLDQRIHR
ncbi:hypothetical protein CHELA20_54037 [Hyphomicrobiales bacterium]|nr:hypothetical protein CHELA20_54037 [Hyphomicrobiales bacterium]